MKPFHWILALALTIGAVFLALNSTSDDDTRTGLSLKPTEQAEGDETGTLPAMPQTSDKVTRSSAAPEPPAIAMETEKAAPVIENSADYDWVLWLDLQGPAVEGQVHVTIRARPDGSPFAGPKTVTASCEINQRTRISLGDLLAPGRALSALVIETKHASLSNKKHSITLASSISTETTPLPAIEATLVLDSSVRVIGHTVHPLGDALMTRIGIWRFKGEQLGGEIQHDERTDGEGHFNIELPAFGDYLIVAAHRDHQPAWQGFSVHSTSLVHEAGTLILKAGAELNGSFTVGGQTPPYPVSFTLQRELKGQNLYWDGSHMGGSPGTMTWTGTGVERTSAQQIADSEGGFRVNGLSPGSYNLHLHGYDQGHARMTSAPLEVFAPSSGLAIELGWSIVAIRLDSEDPSSPPGAAKLVLERPGRAPERTDCFGGELTGQSEREFVFDEGEPLTFQLEIDGMKPLRHELLAPPAGGREVVRFPVPAIAINASLRLVLSGEVPTDGTSFVVHVASLKHGPASPDLGLVPDSNARTVELKEGTLLIESLSPGRVLIMAYPGRWVGQRASHLLDATTELELQSGQETLGYLRFEKAGRLRIGKRNGQGGWAHATCRIRDNDGVMIETTFVSYAPDGGGGSSARGSLSDLAPSQVVPNLLPGQYSVQVGSKTRTVTVRTGETTEVIFD